MCVKLPGLLQAEYNAVQPNDTHLSLAIPELMRILMGRTARLGRGAWAVIQASSLTRTTRFLPRPETWDIYIF